MRVFPSQHLSSLAMCELLVQIVAMAHLGLRINFLLCHNGIGRLAWPKVGAKRTPLQKIQRIPKLPSFLAIFPLIGLLAAIFILPEIYGFEND